MHSVSPQKKPVIARYHFDTDGLKQRIDLRELVAQRWGAPKRHHAKVNFYFARWRDDGSQPSFAVYRDSFKDYGGAGDSGDVFEFLERDLNTDFKGALEYAGNCAAAVQG